ncbi:MAG: GntR family transcriptional regulator [Cypionkella sp.]
MNIDSLKQDRPAKTGSSTAAQVEQDLREAIIRLDLKPGSRLSEQEIADTYGVSRQPVREALIALGKSQLVTVQPKRGTLVVKISARHMMEARFVREAIETAVVRRACKAFDPWVRESIDGILARQITARDAMDYSRFRREDEQFHMAMARGAGCAMAWSVIADIKAHIDRVCNLQLRKPESMAGLIREHQVIMAAIDARDPDRAVAAMQSHLNGILSDLPKIEAEHPDLFEP